MWLLISSTEILYMGLQVLTGYIFCFASLFWLNFQEVKSQIQCLISVNTGQVVDIFISFPLYILKNESSLTVLFYIVVFYFIL